MRELEPAGGIAQDLQDLDGRDECHVRAGRG